MFCRNWGIQVGAVCTAALQKEKVVSVIIRVRIRIRIRIRVRGRLSF